MAAKKQKAISRPGPCTVRLSIPSQLGFEKIAMDVAGSVAHSLGFPADKVNDLCTAVSEACLNAMQHGNQFSSQRFVKVIFRMRAGQLQVDIQDSGHGLQKEPPVPNLERKLAGQEACRGWGIFLIEKLVDRVEFRRLKNKGHVTRLILNIPELAYQH